VSVSTIQKQKAKFSKGNVQRIRHREGVSVKMKIKPTHICTFMSN